MLFGNAFIEEYDDALSHYQCQEIIKHFDKQDLIRGSLGPNHILDLRRKSSWEVKGGNFFNDGSPIGFYIYHSLEKYLTKYVSTHPQTNAIASKWGIDDEYNLQKYNPEQDIHPSKNEQPAITRLTTKSIVPPNEITT